MRLLKWSLLVIFLIIVLIKCFCSYLFGVKDVIGHAELVWHQKGNFGDGKFIYQPQKTFYLSTLESQLSLLDLSAPEMKPQRLAIPADWIAAHNSSDGSIIVVAAALADKRVRIYSINPGDLNFSLLSYIGNSDQLKIDPALTKTEDGWFLTYTTVEGAVNNTDLNTPNGHYEVHLYRSRDLISWEKLKSIVSADRNLEDSRLYYLKDEKRLLFLFEDESINLGPSSIKLMTSKDLGGSWTQPESLIDDGNDNEPAGLIRRGNCNFLFYSSDANNPGESYAGSSAFYIDQDHECVSGQKRRILNMVERILLIDVTSVRLTSPATLISI